MLSDEELAKLTEYIVGIYQEIELELLESVAARFDVYDKAGGSLEWQLKKLDEMGVLNQAAVAIIAKRTKKTKPQILEMMQEAGMANLDPGDIDKAFRAGYIAMDSKALMASEVIRDTINLSYRELSQTYKLIQTKAVESAKQAYMDVINKAYIETASGASDYGSAIRRGLRDMASRGITGATYKRGDKIIHYSLEGTVRRDTISAVHKLANKVQEQTCDIMGAEYVEVSEHIGARVSTKNPIANHAGWQGKVYKLHGSDGKYRNLQEATGYPDDIEGLGGVNCRHRIFAFFPGISVPGKHHVTRKENDKVYFLSQKQRAMERKIRDFKKQEIVCKASGDAENAKKWRARITKQQKILAAFCKENNLVRQTDREMVQEEYL